jgi:hypothetical protein
MLMSRQGMATRVEQQQAANPGEQQCVCTYNSRCSQRELALQQHTQQLQLQDKHTQQPSMLWLDGMMMIMTAT